VYCVNVFVIVQLIKAWWSFFISFTFCYDILVNEDEYSQQARRGFAVLTVQNYRITKSFKNDKLNVKINKQHYWVLRLLSSPLTECLVVRLGPTQFSLESRSRLVSQRALWRNVGLLNSFCRSQTHQSQSAASARWAGDNSIPSWDVFGITVPGTRVTSAGEIPGGNSSPYLYQNG